MDRGHLSVVTHDLITLTKRKRMAGLCRHWSALPSVMLVMSCWTAQGETDWRISSIGVRDMDFYAVSDGSGYGVVLTNSASAVERRCYSDGFHFLSILSTDGIFALRPHPGVDLNGWGSTLYLQPFLPGAVLQGSEVTDCTAYSDRIDVAVTGLVSRGASDQYGTWGLELTCTHDRLGKTLAASGRYTIDLAAPLGDDTGDLNLAKLASNYLDDVPLVDGTTNDTGDMAYAQIVAGLLVTNWNPSLLPGYFPSNQTSNLTVNVVGAFNCVDTRAQGHHAIQAAYKPSLSFSLVSEQEDIPMIFGGIYETGSSSDFAADNVGITPLVLRTSIAPSSARSRRR